MPMNPLKRLLLVFLISSCFAARGGEPQWVHLSSRTGELPVPGPSTEQTGALIADLDKDGTNDFVLKFSQSGSGGGLVSPKRERLGQICDRNQFPDRRGRRGDL